MPRPKWIPVKIIGEWKVFRIFGDVNAGVGTHDKFLLVFGVKSPMQLFELNQAREPTGDSGFQRPKDDTICRFPSSVGVGMPIR
jgi:hypothetical protein